MAKKRRLITRRRLKWAGVAISVPILATMVLSLWSAFGWQGRGHTWERRVGVDGAVLDWDVTRFSESYFPATGPAGSEFYFVRSPFKGVSVRPTWPSLRTVGWHEGTIQTGSLPLWLPLLLIAAPTVWLWRTDCRAKPWQCANCRYDLRGLASESKTVGSEIRPTKCPECGCDSNPGEAS